MRKELRISPAVCHREYLDQLLARLDLGQIFCQWDLRVSCAESQLRLYRSLQLRLEKRITRPDKIRKYLHYYVRRRILGWEELYSFDGCDCQFEQRQSSSIVRYTHLIKNLLPSRIDI